MSEGVILKALSGFYYVDDGQTVCTCRARGKHRHAGLTPLVGDRVRFTPLEKGSGALDEILPRKNEFYRPAVANIDLLVVVASQAIPVTDPFLIDRVAAIAAARGCDTLICVNKCDLEPGEELVLPEVILGHTDRGLGKLSRMFHGLIRNHICRGKYAGQARPVLLNSWEAAYFDFNADTIVRLAESAAQLGIDMVVMDDGWFGKREDDNSGLGDWQVNERKLGCTLGEMIERVNGCGVKFGIWVEPEMVSEDSDLYREHPDWALRIPGREPVRSRNQLVLDFSREEVRNYVFDRICEVLEQGNVEYVKWDMNRSIADVYSARNDQGKVAYDYVIGVYDFLEKLVRRYPHIMIEGCSGGGGRFDAGMLYYTPQIWCSDNTDAVDRVRIQYGTSYCYPISSIGAHVSAVPNHQTGRRTCLHTRGVVAMAGTFGYELDPGKLSEEEKEEVREQVRQFKKHAPLIYHGDYYRLSDPFRDAFGAWMFVSEDRSSALLSAVMLEIHGNMPVQYVRLKGLKPEAVYEDARSHQCYLGAALMNAGLPLPVRLEEYAAYQIELNEKKN